MSISKVKMWVAVGLIPLMGILVIIGVVIPKQQQSRASESMTVYLSKLGIASSTHICNKDSDGDGYASCSYVASGGSIINLECDSALVFNTKSCKRPKNMFNN